MSNIFHTAQNLFVQMHVKLKWRKWEELVKRKENIMQIGIMR